MLTIQRPKTRADCKDGLRPCPWVGCRHHLLLEVALSTGARERATSLRLNAATSAGGRRPGLLPSSAVALVQSWIDDAVELLAQMPATCALDVAEDYPDGLSADAIGRLLGVSKQAIEYEQKSTRKAAARLRRIVRGE